MFILKVWDLIERGRGRGESFWLIDTLDDDLLTLKSVRVHCEVSICMCRVEAWEGRIRERKKRKATPSAHTRLKLIFIMINVTKCVLNEKKQGLTEEYLYCLS